MYLRSTHLDSDTLEYLQAVEKARGDGFPGVFVRRFGTADQSNLRAGSIPLTLLGLAALGIAGYLARPTVLDDGNLSRIAAWQTGLAAAGVLSLLLGLFRMFRRIPKPPFGAFLFADALHLWEVAYDRVTATPLDRLTDADCYHTVIGGTRHYVSSRVELKSRTGATHSVSLSDRDVAERLCRFLYALAVLRRDEADSKGASPSVIGAVAHRLSNGDELPADASFRDPPRPTESRTPTTPAPASMLPRVAIAVAVAGVVGVAGLFAFPVADAAILEAHLFAKIPATDTGRFDEMDYYLTKLPDGKRAGEVRDMRDDRRYAKAVREATGKNSPAALRDYLADEANTRHRPEAQQRINVYYDKAIADLKARADKQAGKTDPKLVEAFVALLEGLKAAGRPVVTVGFTATQDPEPVTPAQKYREKDAYEFRKAGNAALGRIERERGGSAILPLGKTFNPDQTAVRQRVILKRLREALGKGIGSDILALEPVEPGRPAMIEMVYHTYAPGRLYLYTSTTRTTPRFGNPTVTDEVKGLLRGYDVNWTITVRPQQGAAFECKLGSSPATNLNYDSKTSDPDWAPYVIILYSGFYDLSSRLIRNFGLDPGPDPSSFTFDEVTSTKE